MSHKLVSLYIGEGEYYTRTDADKVIAEKDKEIAELKKKLMPCLNGDCILTCEVVEKYGKENAELKKKLEDAKATAYTESVDAGMEYRKLKRALWLARAERAKTEHLSKIMYSTLFRDFIEKWVNVERKCRAKAEEYK